MLRVIEIKYNRIKINQILYKKSFYIILYKMIPSIECIICFEDYNDIIIFDCSHTICLVCYEKILNSNNPKCPVCRSDIDIINNIINNNIIEETQTDTNNYKLIFYVILIIIIISLFVN
jgi:hypothetical protein